MVCLSRWLTEDLRLTSFGQSLQSHSPLLLLLRAFLFTSTCLQAMDPNNPAAAAAAAAMGDGSLEGSSRGGGGGRDGQQKLTMDELFPGLELHQQDAKLQEVGG
jgi:hypothetical protein